MLRHSRTLLACLMSGALFLTACSTSNTVESDSNLDEAAKQLATTNPKVVKNAYFALGIPEGWKVISYDEQTLDTHISVEKIDKSALVTIRINKATFPDLQQSCDHAKQGFDANGIEYTSTPGVSFGTCLINGKENDKEVALWMRQYEDDNSVYSITYSGELQTVSELLTQLAGNGKVMMLMARPLL